VAPEVATIDVPGAAWYIVEKGVKAMPTFTITIERKQAVRVVAGEDAEAEVSHKGVALRFKLLDTELIIDDRYNTALLKRRDKAVAVSDRVRYYGVVMAASDFAAFVRKSVKELINESIAEVGL
jgi:hypothetical protein